MVALLHDLEAVHLQDVAEALVDEQAADRELDRGSGCPDDVRRVAAQDELLERGLDRELVHLGLVVDGQRVVHVEPDPVDARHLQVAVDEDAARPLDSAVDLGGDAVVEGEGKLLDMTRESTLS